MRENIIFDSHKDMILNIKDKSGFIRKDTYIYKYL